MKRVDRRALFATGAAATLLAATGVSLVGAPRRGGHLRIAVPRSPEGLAPVARSAVFETLTELTPEGLLRGRLATSWQAVDDARTWDLAIRHGVVFHDGNPMVAEDVAESLKSAPIGLPGLSEVRVLNDFGLRLILTDPDPHLPIRLASTCCDIRPAKDGARTGLVGTGLYSVRHYSTGGGITAVRTDHHYLQFEAGWADRIDVVAMSDAATRTEALHAGLVEVVLSPDQRRGHGRSGTRTISGAGESAFLISASVGCPTTTVAGDDRIAERLWLL